jgi:uncharacterized membrane protein
MIPSGTIPIGSDPSQRASRNARTSPERSSAPRPPPRAPLIDALISSMQAVVAAGGRRYPQPMLPRAAPKSTLVRVMLVLALLGLGDATYLTVVHYAHITVACAANGNPCETVQTSKYSNLAGVPVALLGAIGYVLIIASMLVREREETRLATLALTLLGFGFSAYLTYQETFTITGHPIYCEWCVGSAIILTILLIVAVFRFLRSPLPLAAPAGELEEPAGASMPARPRPNRPQTKQRPPRARR